MSKTILSEKVKTLRVRKALSQEQLAENTGLSLRTIQRIENGETEPRGDSLMRLANAFEVAPEDLIDWTIKEDKGVLLWLVFSSLSFILFPLLGILVPLLLWTSHKNKVKGADRLGKSVINFQITWCIVLFLAFLVIVILTVFGFDSIGRTGNITMDAVSRITYRNLFVLYGFYLYNVLFIGINFLRAYKEKKPLFFPKFKFLK